jgi:hypothetical protein
MRTAALLAIAFVVAFSSCKRSVTYEGNLIETPDKRNFAFSGKWSPVEPVAYAPTQSSQLTISEPDPKGAYTVESSDFRITFVASGLAFDSNHAIVEVRVEAPDKSVGKYLAYAAAEKDSLYVWWIYSDKLAGILKSERVFAVIEHQSSRSTLVSADAPELLRVLKSNFGKLAGTPEVFRRVE